MSVEYSKLPGQTFYRKTLKCVPANVRCCRSCTDHCYSFISALKLQIQPMLLSTSYNCPTTVLRNLYHAFTEVASKSYHYIRSLPVRKQPENKLFISKSATQKRYSANAAYGR